MADALPAIAVAPGDHTVARSGANVHHILMIEDNPGDVTLLGQALQDINAPVQVHAATSIEAALGFLRRAAASHFGPRPALILLDLNLPAVSGLVGLEVIRQTEGWRDIPVIVMSSSNRAADQDDSRAQGASDYWVKPTVYEGFLECAERLRRLLAYTP